MNQAGRGLRCAQPRGRSWHPTRCGACWRKSISSPSAITMTPTACAPPHEALAGRRSLPADVMYFQSTGAQNRWEDTWALQNGGRAFLLHPRRQPLNMQTLRPRAGAFFVEERQMDWLEEVRARAKRRNKVLFMPGDALFDALSPLTSGRTAAPSSSGRCPWRMTPFRACGRCCRRRRAHGRRAPCAPVESRRSKDARCQSRHLSLSRRG